MKSLFSVSKSNILIIPICLISNMLIGGGPCLENDDCQTAIIISNVISDQSYVCMTGCNEYAAPDSTVAPCQMGDYPTVWYTFVTDAVATILNIEVSSEDFDAPSIAVFKDIA